MTKIDIKNINTAISTWSGFIYQGKVALFHAIKLLTEDSNPSQFNLQLDSLEDFAVLNGEEIISIHQVKAVKSSYYSTYKPEFIKICTKSRKYTCVNVNFHLL